ncbi:MAG: hypothetical protein Unbinned5081contig1001_51 [Prokaryotic dsDNA virus sp.]|nr:MAG: hypothetical protein Unbinned5081contig1001_51 [Prokaryotic dsDNA virus sp.]
MQCAYPECDKDLYPGNQSGVCRTHNHTEHCKCNTCPHKQATEAVSGKKTLEVPYPTSNSGVPSRAKVSVSKAPWEI